MSRVKSLRAFFILNAIVLLIDFLSLNGILWGDLYPDHFDVSMVTYLPDTCVYFSSFFLRILSGIITMLVSLISVVRFLQMKSYTPRKSPLSRFFLFLSLGIIFTQAPLILRYLPFTSTSRYLSIIWLISDMYAQLTIYIITFIFTSIGMVFTILAWLNFSHIARSSKKLVQSAKLFLVFAVFSLIVSFGSMISNIVDIFFIKIYYYRTTLVGFFNLLHTLPVLQYLIISITFGIGYLLVASRLKLVEIETFSDLAFTSEKNKIEKTHKNGLLELYQLSSIEQQQKTLELREKNFSKNIREVENIRNFFSSIFITISVLGILDSVSLLILFWSESPAYQEGVNLIEVQLISNLFFRYHPFHFLISILNIVAAVSLIIMFFRFRLYYPKKSRMIKFLILSSLGMFFFHLVTISRVFPIFSYFYYDPYMGNEIDIDAIIHMGYFVCNFIGTLLNIFAWRNFTQSTKEHKKLYRSGVILQIFSYIGCFASVLGCFGLVIETSLFGHVDIDEFLLIRDLYYIVVYSVLYFYPLGITFMYSIGFFICGFNFRRIHFKPSSTILDIPLEIFDFRFKRIEKTIFYKLSNRIKSYRAKLAARNFCFKCARIINDKDEFCGYCGNSVKKGAEVGVCPKCGNDVHIDDKFCLHCGIAVKNKEN